MDPLQLIVVHAHFIPAFVSTADKIPRVGRRPEILLRDALGLDHLLDLHFKVVKK